MMEELIFIISTKCCIAKSPFCNALILSGFAVITIAFAYFLANKLASIANPVAVLIGHIGLAISIVGIATAALHRAISPNEFDILYDLVPFLVGAVATAISAFRLHYDHIR